MGRSFFDRSLGMDFWNYRLGQLVSLLGDSCSSIALAWWILDKTGSAAVMSSVLAPAMLIRILLLPLLGPLGDKYSRKHLIVIADIGRFVMGAAIAAMVYFDNFNLGLLITAFLISSIGSALFGVASPGIVPNLVTRDQFQIANQQSQAINSVAAILGGILGGVIVSSVGIFGAFVFDMGSYLIAAFCSARIKANTKAEANVSGSEISEAKHPFIAWKD
jgi:MFS family permease